MNDYCFAIYEPFALPYKLNLNFKDGFPSVRVRLTIKLFIISEAWRVTVYTTCSSNNFDTHDAKTVYITLVWMPVESNPTVLLLPLFFILQWISDHNLIYYLDVCKKITVTPHNRRFYRFLPV